MTAVTIIIDIVLILVSILLIITVLMQQGQRQGLGAIGGGAETFFGKNKAKSYEGKLATLTKVCAVVFITLSIVATITAGKYGDTATTTDTSGLVATETVAPGETTSEETAAAADVTTAADETPEATSAE